MAQLLKHPLQHETHTSPQAQSQQQGLIPYLQTLKFYPWVFGDAFQRSLKEYEGRIWGTFRDATFGVANFHPLKPL